MTDQKHFSLNTWNTSVFTQIYFKKAIHPIWDSWWAF